MPVIAVVKNASLMGLGTLANEIQPFLNPEWYKVPLHHKQADALDLLSPPVPLPEWPITLDPSMRTRGLKYVGDICTTQRSPEHVNYGAGGQISLAAR